MENHTPLKPPQIIRSRRKTLALIVKPDASLIVRAPLRTPQRTIKDFLEKNTGWVKRKQAEALAALPPGPKQYVPGECFMYLGNSYPLVIQREQKQPLLLEESFKLAGEAQDNADLVFERWYRARAKETIGERVDLYASQHGFQYKRVGITSARTRWGSCSPNGSLNFSWRLILAPLEAVDYVVVHELVHTVFHNHSRRFWKHVETILPDYQVHRKWLKANASRLTL